MTKGKGKKGKAVDPDVGTVVSIERDGETISGVFAGRDDSGSAIIKGGSVAAGDELVPYDTPLRVDVAAADIKAL